MPLVLIGLIPSLVAVVLLVILLGAFAGIAYVTGYTIVGSEVDDDTRGRTFAFLQSGIRVILFAVIAIAPFIAGAFTALVHGATGSSTLHIGHVDYAAIGYNFVLILAAVVAVWLGVVSYRQMDDRKGVRSATTWPRWCAAAHSRRCPRIPTAGPGRPPAAAAC